MPILVTLSCGHSYRTWFPPVKNAGVQCRECREMRMVVSITTKFDNDNDAPKEKPDA